MDRNILRVFFATVAIVIFVWVIKTSVYKGRGFDADLASVRGVDVVNLAWEKFEELKNEGKDVSNGPCLTNELTPDWVADLVHVPREAIDNLPENQCSAFREGKAHHFVELDLKGSLVRAI